MSIDARTRRFKDIRELPPDEVYDDVLPRAIEANGELAGRGVAYKGLPPLGFDVDGRGVTLRERGGRIVLLPGVAEAGVVGQVSAEGLSELVQDTASPMGLAMTSKVRITEGSLENWLDWEAPLRALLDGRPVHEDGAVTFVDADGVALDLGRTFTLDDDPEEVAHFLHQAGFLHVRGVFDEGEMEAVGRDIDTWIDRAEPDDGESWWAVDDEGRDRAVRVLWFHEKSEALARLLHDERLQWLAGLTGDDFATDSMGAEGLVKPLGIVKGLSDLPWHKDCGQGYHAYRCSGMTVGISVTGADRTSGALGVVPGSHRANTHAAMLDRRLDLKPIMLETRTGDLTVHCSDTLHRAHPPVDRPRKVVYTGFGLRPLPDDEVRPAPKREARAARAALTDVTDRIEAADNTRNERRFRAVRPGG